VRRIGILYRLDVKAIEVQTASVQGQWNRNIPHGMTIAALTTNTGGGTAAAAAPTGGRTQPAAAGGTATPAAAQPAAPAGIANGTYIFFPRPRAMTAGRDVDAYLDRIVVRGGFLNIHLTGTPTGDASRSGPQGPNFWYVGTEWYTLQDLDTPRLSYNPVNVTYENPRTISFQNIRQGRRFSLSVDWHRTGVPHIFEEIDLDKAEFEP